MDAFEVLLEQIDTEIKVVEKHLSNGKAANYDEYKRLCGQIQGLLLAHGFIKDLKQKMEYADD